MQCARSRLISSSFMQCKAENQPQRRSAHQQHLSVNCTPHSYGYYREAALTTSETCKIPGEEITLPGRTPSPCNVSAKAQHLRTTLSWTSGAFFSYNPGDNALTGNSPHYLQNKMSSFLAEFAQFLQWHRFEEAQELSWIIF